MKTKNIFNVMLLAVSALLFTSCLNDEDEVFGDSSSARLQAALKEAKAVLRGAENGWVMDYYIGDDSSDGGYAFIVKFDSLTCTAMSEVTDTVDTSYYKMTTDNGPVLTFDTYNQVLHEFATPSSDEYEGKHADFEFLIMSAKPDLVVLKGKRTGNMIYLHPLMKDAKKYLEDVRAMQDSLIVSSGVGTLGGVTVNATFDLNGRQAEFVNPDDPSTVVSCAFTYTDTGIRLNKTVDFASKPISGFAYDGTTRRLTCTDASNPDFVMQGYTPAGWREYDAFEGTYDLSFGSDINNLETFRVQLVSNNDGATYRMTGLNSKYDIQCDYNRGRGALEIHPQALGSESGVEVRLCMLDNKSEFLVWNPAAGVIFIWNGDEEHPVYNSETNSYEDFMSAGLIIWAFKESGQAMTSSDVSSWLQSHSSWYFGGTTNSIDMLRSLTKVD